MGSVSHGNVSAGARAATRAVAIAAVAAIVAMTAACSRAPPHVQQPGRVVHARLEFLAEDLRTPIPAQPPRSYRLWFPYVIGDLYGAPGAGDFVQAAVHPDGTIDIDLGASEPDLVRSLEPTDFSLSYLRIEPASARIARLAPAALQADGIDRIGGTDWVDLDTRERLMLVYADRPARISGATVARGTPVRYDIRFAAAGYVWVGGRETPGGGTAYVAVPAPRHLALVVTPAAAGGKR